MDFAPLFSVISVVFFLAIGFSVFIPARWLVITYGVAALLMGFVGLIDLLF